MEKKFIVHGMTCTNCSSGIERFISKQNGINSCTVSLIDKVMTVDYDPSIISTATIVALVEKLGYSIVEEGKTKIDKYADAKVLKNRFLVSLILLIPLTYLCLARTLSLYTFNDIISLPLQFLLASTILLINKKFFISGTKAVINGAPNMDTLVALGSASAYIYSVVITIAFIITGKLTHTFFDGSAMVLTLVTLGKYLEELSKIKTGDAIDGLGKLIPKTATVIRNGEELVVLTTQVVVGDIVLVKTGEYLAIDGVVIDGHATLDKSNITGESLPVEINIGDIVTSGSIVTFGYIKVRAEKVGTDTLLSEIIRAVKQAGASKAPVQKFADRVAKYFVPVVCSISLLVFVIWLIISKDITLSLNFAIDVLVISCPCALGLATPVAVTATMGNLARRGVLFKSAETIEKAHKIDCVLLDKTATLTVGKPTVTDFYNLSTLSNDEISLIATSLENNSSHPLANSIVEYFNGDKVAVTEYEYIIGKGVKGKVFNKLYYIGSSKILPLNINTEDAFEMAKELNGKTVLFLADENEVLAVFGIADLIKEDSAFAIKSLLDKGVECAMITGDNLLVANIVAKQVGIKNIHAEVLPNQKYQIVKDYKEKGYLVAMVGDGVNDSPALSGADLGIAMGTGTDIAIDSADVVISNGNISAVSDMLSFSKKSYRIIKQNLFWAFIYNLLALPVAGGALFSLGITLSPMIASACMCCSSLFVVTNALRLRAKKQKIKKQKTKSEDITITIQKMMCAHCEQKAKDALLLLDGEAQVKVDFKTKKASIKTDKGLTDAQVEQALSSVGFIADDIQRLKYNGNSH